MYDDHGEAIRFIDQIGWRTLGMHRWQRHFVAGPTARPPRRSDLTGFHIDNLRISAHRFSTPTATPSTCAGRTNPFYVREKRLARRTHKFQSVNGVPSGSAPRPGTQISLLRNLAPE